MWPDGILCLGHMTSALLKHKNQHCIIDSLSRMNKGIPVDQGTSVLLHFNSIEECWLYITELGTYHEP